MVVISTEKALFIQFIVKKIDLFAKKLNINNLNMHSR